MPLDAPATSAVKRVGFLSGHITVPDDFGRMHDAEIAHLFGDEA